MQANNTPKIRYIVHLKCLRAIRNATFAFLCALALLLFVFKPFAEFTLAGFAEVITVGSVLSLSGAIHVPRRIPVYGILAVPVVVWVQYLIGVSVSTATILILLYKICQLDITTAKVVVTGATAFLACEICEALGHHSGGQ